MSLESNEVYEFADFRLDLAEKVLLRDKQPIPITPKVFETLCVFVENAGQLVEKNVLMERLWQDRFVEESNLEFVSKVVELRFCILVGAACYRRFSKPVIKMA